MLLRVAFRLPGQLTTGRGDVNAASSAVYAASSAAADHNYDDDDTDESGQRYMLPQVAFREL